mmetsp:Transcript_48677/g.136102  ORF Transcript_48677/g.136102 Transcript_48677/m.136102 type:complete len:214 (+) Transcript_48677:1555-2196(+)
MRQGPMQCDEVPLNHRRGAHTVPLDPAAVVVPDDVPQASHRVLEKQDQREACGNARPKHQFRGCRGDVLQEPQENPAELEEADQADKAEEAPASKRVRGGVHVQEGHQDVEDDQADVEEEPRLEVVGGYGKGLLDQGTAMVESRGEVHEHVYGPDKSEGQVHGWYEEWLLFQHGHHGGASEVDKHNGQADDVPSEAPLRPRMHHERLPQGEVL